MSTSFDVVTYGEALVVFTAVEAGPLARAQHFARHAAGAELNVAIGLARLGLRVGWLSRVGRDSFGEFLLETLATEGIDTSAVGVDEAHPTGFYLKARCLDGSDPEIEYFRRGSAASFLSVADARPEHFVGARHLHLSGIGPAISDSSYELALHLAATARAQGQCISFDPNLRPRLWRSRAEMVARLNALADLTHWVMPGLEEGRILTGETSPEAIAAFYLARGVRGVVVKLGCDGAYLRTADAEACVPAVSVAQIVDTVGAGDGFAVGFISALLEGRDAVSAAARGNLIGGMAIQVIGDSEGFPSRERLDAAEQPLRSEVVTLA